jgi:hypothetical protein
MDGFHGGAVPDDGEIFIPCFDCPMLVMGLEAFTVHQGFPQVCLGGITTWD